MTHPIIEQIKGKLIVSCQAYPGEPLRHPETMAQMARACELGGAAAIRCQGLADISAIKGRVEVPVIGLWKDGHEGVYITPTLRHAKACVAAGADIVAIDATDRPRPDGKSFADTVAGLKGETIIMADCATIEDIRNAFALGVDICSTTLSHPGAAIDCGMADGPNTELIAQGVANLASPLFGGIPATGAIARTMTNINNGGRSPIAGVIHAMVLLLIFLFLMPLAQYIPMACLAGVLVIVSYGMSGWRSFLALTKNPKSDVTVLLITFFLTIIFDLTIAIEVGLIIACLLFMRRMSETTDVKVILDEIDPNQESELSSGNLEHLTIPEGVEVYEINGPYFFGAGNKFEEVMAVFGDRPKVRIIRMRKVPFVDSTGIHNLTNLCEMSKKEGIEVVLSGVTPKVHQTLAHAGFYRHVPEEDICSHINLALERAKVILAKAY